MSSFRQEFLSFFISFEIFPHRKITRKNIKSLKVKLFEESKLHNAYYYY